MSEEIRSESDWHALLTKEMARRGRDYYRIAYSLLRNGAAAEDACQRARVNAYGQIGGLRLAGSLQSWLGQIVAKECLWMLRRDRAEKQMLAERADRKRAATSSEADWMMREAVIEAVEELPESLREVARLRLLQGLSGNEVARLLNCSAASVTRYMQSAMELLREILRDWNPKENNEKRGD